MHWVDANRNDNFTEARTRVPDWGPFRRMDPWEILGRGG